MYRTSSSLRGNRRFTAAGFAFLYAFLVFSATGERATEAIADALGHSGKHHHVASSSSLKRTDTRLTQTKINEPGFTVELSREAVAGPILSERHTPVSTSEFRSTWCGSFFSTRAPPSLI